MNDTATRSAVLLSLEEVLAPPRTALVVWDMQVGVAGRALNIDDIRGPIDRLIAAAHSAGVSVIWSKHVSPSIAYMPPPVLRAMMLRQGVRSTEGLRGGLQAGSPETELVEGLAVGPDDIVIEKSTASFFVGTPLELRLRAHATETVVLVGVATEHGIEFTARHASALGFHVVVIEDAVGTYNKQAHENSVSYLRSTVNVITSRDAIAAWSASG
jgi:nicotinamidase-related amidase